MKRVFSLLMILVCAIALTGCGADPPKNSADATIKAITQIYLNDKTNAGISGLPQKDIDAILYKNKTEAKSMFAEYNLTESQQELLADKFYNKLREKANLQTSIKTKSDTEPVVEISMSRIDDKHFVSMLTEDAAVKNLVLTRAYIEQGIAVNMTMDEYRTAITTRLSEVIDALKVTAPEKMDVKCKLGNDADDNAIWITDSADQIGKFVLKDK